MKKLILAFAAMFTFVVSANAMSYEQARDQALFLTDKMAYELNLTDDQYEAAYEVNLDYLMSINNYDEVYNTYWQQRNLDLSYILLDWQYRAFVNASYFYRPLYWDAGYWHFAIYARYPHRTYLYFGRPHFVSVYRGGHSWRVNGGRSWYHGRRFGGMYSNGNPRIGMRDGFQRGDYGKGSHYRQDRNNQRPNGNRNNSHFNGRPNNNNNRFNNNNERQGISNTHHNDNNINRPSSKPNGNRSFGNRQSSTRTTVVRSDNPGNSNNRTSGFSTNSNRRSFNTNSRSGIFGGNKSNNVPQQRPTSSPNRSSVRNNSPRSFGGGNKSTPTTRSQSQGGGHNGGGHFGGRR